MDVYQRRRLVALSAIAVVFIVIVLMIRSCGGEDEEPVATAPLAGATGLEGPTSLTQEDFVAQGDAICVQANTAIVQIDESDALTAAAEAASAVEGELQGMQALAADTPPDQGQEELDAFLSELQKHYELLQDRVTAVENEDEGAQAELDLRVADQESKVAKAARKFGFEDCGDPEAVGETTSAGEGETTSAGEGETGEETSEGTEGTAPPATTPVPPPATTPVAPPADTGTDDGGVGTTPPVTPPADTGGTDPGSGGVSP